MLDDNFETPVLLVPLKIDVDVVAAISLWLLLNYKDQARQVLLEAPLEIVRLQFRYNEQEFQKIWPNRRPLAVDVGREYRPGLIYDHHFKGGAESATEVVWQEFQETVTNEQELSSYQNLVAFVNEVDSCKSYFDTNHILLERIVLLLHLTNTSVLNNSAFGPAHLPNALAKTIKRYSDKYLTPEQVKSVLLKGFDLIADWLQEEREIHQLKQEQEIRPVGELVDVISIKTNLLPDRLRYLYNRIYRFQQKKFYVLVALVDYSSHRQLVVQSLLTSVVAKVNLLSLGSWLTYRFAIPKSEIRFFKNNNILSAKLQEELLEFPLQPVADYLRYNIVYQEDPRLQLLGKLFTKIFSFVDYHNDNKALLNETFELFWRMLRLVQKSEDLVPFVKALDEIENNVQLRSDSYSNLAALNGDDFSATPVVEQSDEFIKSGK